MVLYLSVSLILFNVGVVKGVAAFGTELRGMLRILRLPAAFITAVERYAGRFLGAAILAELALVYCTAGAGPPVLGRLR